MGKGSAHLVLIIHQHLFAILDASADEPLHTGGLADGCQGVIQVFLVNLRPGRIADDHAGRDHFGQRQGRCLRAAEHDPLTYDFSGGCRRFLLVAIVAQTVAGPHLSQRQAPQVSDRAVQTVMGP